jgi:hypothetical protein
MSTPPDSQPHLPAADAGPTSAAPAVSNPPASSQPLSPAAKRARRYRKRRREGAWHVTIELAAPDIDGLVRTQFLEEEHRDDPEMLVTAVLGIVYDAAEGKLIRRKPISGGSM